MSRRNRDRHFDMIEVRGETEWFEVNIRCKEDRKGVISFYAQMPNTGHRLENVDPNVLKKMITFEIKSVKKLKWEKMIVVNAGIERDWQTKAKHDYSTDGRHEIRFFWKIILRCDNPNKGEREGDEYLWKEVDDDDHDHDTYCRHTDREDEPMTRIIPWTKQREDLCQEISLHIGRVAERVELFFSDEDIANKLDNIRIDRLLTSGGRE